MAWTREQEEIIARRSGNLLVSAAAGSGKTAVLVERIVQMTLDPKNPINLDEMLVVTFTKAAASQMRERVEKKLEEELEQNPNNEHLLRQISLIHRAQITTIHSFCMDTVKNHFYKLSLDPNFRIGEEGEISLLKQEVLDEILEESYANPSASFIALVESYAPGKSDKAIEDLILRIYEFSVSSPRPEKWLEDAKREFLAQNSKELEQSKWMQNLLANAKKQLSYAAQSLLAAMEYLPEAALRFRTLLKGEYDFLSQVLEAASYEECRNLLEGAKFSRWPTLTKKEKEAGILAEEISKAKELRDLAKKTQNEVRDKFFFYSIEEQFRQMLDVADTVTGMLDLVLLFYERFEEKKREKNVFEFHDLEHFALALFVDEYETADSLLDAKPSEIALELRRQYRAIFIDEYQDSNMVQELLLTVISREKEEGNLFMVGDMKQSIYKFRMARPEIFQEKYDRYKEGETRDKKIELRNNFRSRKEVLEAANFIFYQTMKKDFANMSYSEKNRLVPSKPFADWNGDRNQTEILLLNLEKTQEAAWEVDDTKEEYTKVELEAKLVANKIRELTSGEKPFFVESESGEKRRAEYKDIAILLRTMSNTAEIFEEVLSEAGIFVCLDSTKNSFRAVEIKTAVSLLEVIDNRYLDIPLVAVLRSPIVGLGGEELAEIRNLVIREKRGEYSFYEYLEFYLETGESGQLKQKLRSFIGVLDELRAERTYLSIEDLIWSAFEKTGYYRYVAGMPNGKRRQANLDMLMRKAAKYEETSYRGLFQFIRYVRQLNNYEAEFGTTAGLTEDNSVRIMSIHKSKGLEFPIVFVSQLSKRFNYRDVNQKLVLHQDYYIGVDKIDYIIREKTPTLKKRFLQEVLKLEMLQEELRVLYVAMTRAREKLILTAAVKELGSYIKQPIGDVKFRRRGLSYLTMIRARTYLDWIMPALCNEASTDFLFESYGVSKAENLSYIDEKESALFLFTVVSPQAVVSEAVEREITQQLSKKELSQKRWRGSEREREKLKKTFAYEYPNRKAVEARGKWSVSELKRQLPPSDEDNQLRELVLWDNDREEGKSEEEFVPTLPDFLSEKKELVSTARGTAIHRVLELLDFRKIQDFSSFKEELINLFERKQIDKKAYEAAVKINLYSLWRSKIGKRLSLAAKCGRLYKERQFMIGVPLRELETAQESGELVLLQGIIDLYFEEEDGIVIIDYKTDYIPIGEEKNWVEKYRTQVLYYKRALEQMTGKKVKEMYLYAFSRKTLFAL